MSEQQQTLTIQQAIDLGVQHHNAGRLPEAEGIYQQILQTNPDQPVALHFLGVIAHQVGKNDIAADLITKALAIKPDYAEARNNLGRTFLAQNRFDEAVANYQKALAIKPNFIEAHNNLGQALQALGKLEEAVDCYNRAIAINSEFAEAHNNLGTIHYANGCLDDAEKCFCRVLKIEPDHVRAHNNLGNLLMEKGNLTEAEQHCRRAVSLDADFHLAHNNLGNILMNLGRLEEAEKCYRDAIGLRSNYDIAIDNLCTILLRRGKPEEVLALCRKALELNPNNLNAHVSLAKSLDNLVPIWHTPMMNDDTRNDAYLDALQSVITPRTHVLEIGTGSGLLALMAAKSGAEKVTTCEVSPLIAATAREIILTNGMAGAINVIAKKSNNIEIGIDLPRPADVLVSEIFSNELIGEGVLSSIDDARRRLLSPGGRIIPSGGAIMIALFGGDHIRKAIMVDNVNGFDMRKFNLITSNKRSLNAYNYDVELLTDDIEAFNFDFYQKAPTRPEQKKLKICVTKAGRCYGIIQWIRVQLDDTIVFENHPSIKTPVSGWKHVTYILDKPINVELDQVAVITGIHNRIAPWFVLDRIE